MDIEFMNISDSNPNEKLRRLCLNVMKHAHSRNIKEYLLMQWAKNSPNVTKTEHIFLLAHIWDVGFIFSLKGEVLDSYKVE